MWATQISMLNATNKNVSVSQTQIRLDPRLSICIRQALVVAQK